MYRGDGVRDLRVCGISAVTGTTLVSSQICKTDARKTASVYTSLFTQIAAIWSSDLTTHVATVSLTIVHRGDYKNLHCKSY